jgi:acyl carrier protein
MATEGDETMNVEAAVREFLRDHLVLRHVSDTISADDSLLDSGLLDSAGLFELVSFLEDRFGIVIGDEELVPDNFETINAIAALVRPKVEGIAAGGDTHS